MSLSDYLAVAGFSIVIYQLWRTGRIATSTKRAVVSTVGRLSTYNFLLLLPELIMVEQDLERASLSDDEPETSRLLREWQVRASEMRGVLLAEQVRVDGLPELIQASLVATTRAQSKISKGSGVRAATAAARAAAVQVCISARSGGAHLRSSPVVEEADPTPAEDLRKLLQSGVRFIKSKTSRSSDNAISG